MKSCDMVIVVPVDKHTGNDEVLRLQAWGEVSELLRPGLGKLYRQFNPSGSAWERKYPRPFGVVLGRQEPEVFRELLKAGEEAQHEAVAFHLEAMLRKADLGSAQKIGDTQVYSAVVDGSDPELLAHGVWHILMQKALLFRTAAFTMPRCTVHPQPRRKSARSWIMSANTQCAWSR